MGEEHQNNRKRKSARRSIAAEAMVRPKGKAVSGSFRAENRRLSVRFYSVVLSLVLLLGALLLFYYIRRYSAISHRGRHQGGVVKREMRVFGYEVVTEFPHDPDAFTQGLFYDANDTFYESTGLYGKSSLRKVDIKTGKVMQYQKMDHTLFGEGLTLWGSRLLQVTWLTKIGIMYDKETLKPVGSFKHPMQDGWGLTSGEEHIIGSDGTANIYFMDPFTFKVIRKVIVTDDGRTVQFLNELEYIKGEIWANVYQTECIARIDPKDGRVTGWLRMHGLRSALLAQGVTRMDVLNGIAWDSEQDRLFVTGKQWPKVYEIKLVDQTSQHKDLTAVRQGCIY